MDNLKIIKNRLLPEFYQDESPKMVELLGDYLKWMSEEGNPYWLTDHLTDFTDIDSSVDMYQEHLRNELMVNFPINYSGDIKYIMKNLLMLYRAKGTVASMEFFFRSVYNSFCRVSYPKEKMLKTSDGKWIQGYYIYTPDIPTNLIAKYQSYVIQSEERLLTGLISDVVPHYYNGENEYKYSFNIIDNTKPFREGELCKILNTEPPVYFTIQKQEYTKGHWIGSEGMLDSDMMLQDSYYYQNFSYELTTMIPIAEYREIVNLLFNPAGMLMFGKLQMYEHLEEYNKEETTSIHWWIIQIFMGVYATLKSVESNTIIKHINPSGQIGNSDYDLYYKNYDTVGHYRDLTPIDLMTNTNYASRIVYSMDGKMMSCDWLNMKMPKDELNYYIQHISPTNPCIELDCINGAIDIDIQRYKNKSVMVFVDGIKLCDSDIISTPTGYSIPSYTGKVVMYFYEPMIINKFEKIVSKGEIINYSRWNVSNIAVWIDGLFVREGISETKFVAPADGKVEIYILKQHESSKIETKYYTTNNELICEDVVRCKYK